MNLFNKIMINLRKYRFAVVSFLIISLTYFVSRIVSIMQLPIFTDEAIYTRWSQIAYNDANWRFISLTDGKQPLFVWLQMAFMHFFDDPLFAGRLVSVLAGFGALVGVFFLTQLIFKNIKVSLFAAFLYLIYPFALIYDRLALYESLLAMFFIWALYFQILLVKKMRLDIAMILGFVLGGAVLTKSSGFLSIYMMPFLYLLLDFGKRAFKVNALKFTVFLVVSIILANAIYAILRLSPFFHIIEQKNSIFVYPVSEWLRFSLDIKIANFISNLRGIFDWFVIYFSVPFILAMFFSFSVKSLYREKIILLLWFLLPVSALILFGKTIYPRYLFFMTLPLLPLVAVGFLKLVEVVKSKIAIGFIIIAFFMYPIYTNYMILINFQDAPIPVLDREQLINGWPAGGGVKESIEFFENEARNKQIIIATQGTFGLMPYSYEIYLNENSNIEVRGYWPIEDNPPRELLDAEKDVYVVFYQPCPQCRYPGDAPDTWPIEKIREYRKGDGITTLGLYKFLQ